MKDIFEAAKKQEELRVSIVDALISFNDSIKAIYEETDNEETDNEIDQDIWDFYNVDLNFCSLKDIFVTEDFLKATFEWLDPYDDLFDCTINIKLYRHWLEMTPEECYKEIVRSSNELKLSKLKEELRFNLIRNKDIEEELEEYSK